MSFFVWPENYVLIYMCVSIYYKIQEGFSLEEFSKNSNFLPWKNQSINKNQIIVFSFYIYLLDSDSLDSSNFKLTNILKLHSIFMDPIYWIKELIDSLSLNSKTKKRYILCENQLIDRQLKFYIYLTLPFMIDHI